MSHTVTVKAVEVKDLQALLQAAGKNQEVELLADGEVTSHKLYQREYTGVGVKLKGWNYPVVFDLESGQCYYDNYNGRWGVQDELDSFLQDYVEEATMNAAVAQDPGVSVFREELEDGSVRLTLEYADAG